MDENEDENRHFSFSISFFKIDSYTPDYELVGGKNQEQSEEIMGKALQDYYTYLAVTGGEKGENRERWIGDFFNNNFSYDNFSVDYIFSSNIFSSTLSHLVINDMLLPFKHEDSFELVIRQITNSPFKETTIQTYLWGWG